MTASEIAFLVMGFLLGVAGGAVLIAYTRSHPPVSRDVRVTMAPDAIPRRRSTTLADDAFTPTVAAAEPARGGPADRRSDGAATPPPGPDRRTPVRAGSGIAAATDGVGEGLPSMPRPGTMREPIFRLSTPSGAAVPMAGQAVPVSGGDDPTMTALRAAAARDAELAMAALRRETMVPAPIGGGSGSTGDGRGWAAVLDGTPMAEGPSNAGRSSGDGSNGAGPAVPATASTDVGPADDTDSDATDAAVATTDPCAEPKRLADERCELATRARAGAVAAEETLRASQRALEEHEAAAETAALAADSRTVRQAKDDAQARFRSGRAKAATTDDVEAAARAWLLQINAINGAAREAVAALSLERDLANEIAQGLERLSLDADAARILAETAEAACLAARQELADCDEREAAGPRSHRPVLPPSDPEDELPIAVSAGAAALGSSASPRIFRLLRGDREAMGEMVRALAGDDAAERRKWQVAMSDLVDAILASSIAAAALDFPQDHPFWGPFTLEQNREIAQALSSLGYRFDGLGGWVDERVPSQRDLSLALGYAGLDPMRMRNWPTEHEMVELYSEVEVAGAEHLSGAAGDLTLGELVSMLGRRADGLAEVWNQWGKIRPLLLEEG